MKKNHTWFRKHPILKKIWKQYKAVKRFFRYEDLRKTFYKKTIRAFRVFIGIGGIYPYKHPLDIIHANNDFVVINKEAGMLTHPTGHNEKDTVLNALLFYLGKKGNKHKNMPGPISRLDRDTSGIILFALSPSSKSFFGKTMEEKKFVKKYWVLVSGKTEEKGKIDIPLFHNRVTRKMEASSHEEGKKSITLFKRKEYFQRANMSFVEVELITGRMHQIRAHFSLLGFPVVGDILYGNQEINTFCEKHFSLKQNFLHAHSLSWEDSGKIFSFESPLPKALEEMKRRIENEE